MEIDISKLTAKQMSAINKISEIKYCNLCKAILNDINWKQNSNSDGYSRFACDQCQYDRTNGYRRTRRLKLLNEYGNKCNCCGYDTDLRALDIDHVFNDGAEERKTVKDIVIHITNLNFPKDRYQLLCRNCNKIKHFNKGICNCKELESQTLKIKEYKRKSKYDNVKFRPLEEKKCTDCSILLNDTNYKPQKSDKKGNLKYICIQCSVERQRNGFLKRRKLVLDHYGHKCNTCLYDKPMGLEIDHVNNDGNLDRKTNKIKCLYRHVIQLKFPVNYQVLCSNCNYLKHQDNK